MTASPAAASADAVPPVAQSAKPSAASSWPRTTAAGLSRFAHGEKRRAGAGQRASGRSFRLGEGGREVRCAGHHLAGRAHLGPQHRVGPGKARERKDRRLHARRGSGGSRPARRTSPSRAPAARRHAAATRFTSRAFETKGTVREALGFASRTIETAVQERELDVDETDHPEGGREPARPCRCTRSRISVRQPDRREHAGGVARVDAGLLDMLHESGDPGVLPVAERVDVELDGALEKAVDENPAGASGGAGHVLGPVADAHPPPAEHVRGPDEHRVADLLGDVDGARPGRPPCPRRGRPSPSRPHRSAKRSRSSARSTASYGVPEDPHALLLERAGKLERRLAAELDDDALRPFARADLQHLLGAKGLEVEPVGRVVVGGDGLGIAVDHDRLVAECAEGLHGVDAAVVELDALADPVRPRAENDDRAASARPAATRPPRPRSSRGSSSSPPPRRRTSRPAETTGARPRSGGAARSASSLSPQAVGEVGVRPAEPLEAEPVGLDEVRAPSGRGERRARSLQLLPKPWMQPRREVVERRPRRLRAGIELARAHRLQERLRERPPDAHRLAHRLHLRPQLLVGARELLEGEPGELDDDVVEGRLEARRRRLREVVRDLVQRVADRELRRHLGDRVAGRLARERRGAGDARVHLDHAQLAALALPRELDVGAAGLDPDGADHAGGRVAELLEGLVGEGHLRRDGDGVAGVHAHRVEVLDRADDDDVVPRVPHHLELELVPADQRLLDEHLAHRALGEGALELALELLRRARDAAAVTAERERGAEDQREGERLGQLARAR